MAAPNLLVCKQFPRDRIVSTWGNIGNGCVTVLNGGRKCAWNYGSHCAHQAAYYGPRDRNIRKGQTTHINKLDEI